MSDDSQEVRAAAQRPVPRAVSITSTDIAAVQETYHTDCEIVATDGDEPHRVFPVNRLVVGSWSEPFRVMVDGKFIEGQNRRIELPYTAATVEIAVLHMYSILRLVEAPVVPPAHAFSVLRLAHMYSQRDLYERCIAPLRESDYFIEDADADPVQLRTLLLMGLSAAYVHEFVERRAASFPPFSLDVHDEVMKPYITEMLSQPLTDAVILSLSEYTEELREAAAYHLESPEVWEETTTRHLREGYDLRCLERQYIFTRDVSVHATITHCGVLTQYALCQNLRDIVPEQGFAEEDVAEAARLLELFDSMLDTDYQDYCTGEFIDYRKLMKKLFPMLPARPKEARYL